MKFIPLNFLSIVLFTTQLNSQPLLAKKLPTAKNKIIVIAHRGDHTMAPENSLLSIQNAIDDGVDYVELDIRTTQDSQLVLMHDATVDRMTNGHGKIAEMKFDSIRNLKLYNKNAPTSDTSLVPRFEEALAICKNKINIYLDFKNADVKKVYEVIRAAHMQDQMVVYINTPIQFVEWRKQVPSMPLIVSLNAKVKDSIEMFKYLSSVNIDILDGNWNEYTQETVQAALSKGVPVWADMQAAVEGEAYWNKGIELGLLGIQTDHPKELIQYLKKLSLASKK